ncbi:MAG: trypsin-like peptidase domain-containing protein, partial [Actinomycetota bacterium]|nr:trypsin-like peptidase domain-containing protein [Actinomycetota bacterium]
ALSRRLNQQRQVVGGLGNDLAGLDERLGIVEEDAREREERSIDEREVAANALPSVVTVTCGSGQGSGFAVLADGIPAGFASAILTNHHVIADCAASPDVPAQVSQDGTTYRTELVSWDERNDLALLYVNESLTPIRPAARPQQGDRVVAIGSPYGLEGTTTSGIISKIWPRGYQTDAAINFGNSGGPLLDRRGRVLGVNTQKLAGGEGVNFAVSTAAACEQLLVDNCRYQ